MPHVVPAELSHGEALLADMRPADRRECLAAWGPDGLTVLAQHMQHVLSLSKAEAVVDDGGQTLLIFGSHPDGKVWALGTTHAHKHNRSFLTLGKRVIEQLAAGRPRLYCWTDERNTTHHRWLSWCGFRPTGKRERRELAAVWFYEYERKPLNV